MGVGEPPPVAKVAPPAPFPAPSGGVVFGPQEEPERYAMGEELGNGATATVCRPRKDVSSRPCGAGVPDNRMASNSPSWPLRGLT